MDLGDSRQSSISDGLRDCEIKTNPPNESRDNSAIGSIPEDILTLILDIVHDSDDDDETRTFQALRSRKKLPTIVAHVSRFWRSVALDNPLWWSNIVIRPLSRIEAVEEYLKRSKECRLEISFFGYEDKRILTRNTPPYTPPEEYQRRFDLLFPYFRRCRVLQIRGVFNQNQQLPFSSLERLLDADMPCLEEFVFEGDLCHYDPAFSMRGLKPLFSSAPLLRTLGVIKIGIGQFNIPSALLTNLHLKGSSAHLTSFLDLQKALEACHSLTTLAMYDDMELNNPLAATGNLCNVPTLQRLYILGGDMLCVSELLLFFKAPLLRELVIAPIVARDLELLLDESKENPNFYQHYFPELRSLTLSPANSPTFQGVVEMASTCFPQTERLILANLYLSSFIEVFSKKIEGIDVFPNLLDLALTNVDRTFAEAIQDVEQARGEQRRPLKNVYVDSESFKQLKEYSIRGEENANECEYFRLNLVEGNLWEDQRRRILFNEYV